MGAALNAARTPTLHDVLAHLGGRGDTWAMNELIRAYDQLLGKFSWALLKGMESTTAEDLKQTATLAMIELAGTYRIETASWMTYVYRFLPLRMKRLSDGVFQDRMVSPPVNALHKDRSRVAKGEKASFRLNGSVSLSGHRAVSDGTLDLLSEDDFLALVCPDSVTPDTAEHALLVKQVMSAVDNLPHRDAALIRSYFINEKTLQEIADDSGGITRQGINAALARSLAKLRNTINRGKQNATRTQVSSIRAVTGC